MANGNLLSRYAYLTLTKNKIIMAKWKGISPIDIFIFKNNSYLFETRYLHLMS